MESLLREFAHYVALAIEAIAILVVAYGTGRAVLDVGRLALMREKSDMQARVIWLRYAHILVAGLTFQLAADIVGTTVAPTWEEVGRLASVAGIRTFLSYFLDREVASREREEVVRAARSGPADRLKAMESGSAHG
jgi:uncharacterized membrane protein